LEKRLDFLSVLCYNVSTKKERKIKMKQINSNYNTRGRKTKFFSVVGSNDKVHFTTIMEDVTEREAMIEAGKAFDDYEYVAIVRTMLDMNGTPRNSHWKWC
jgi:hypothetical protein